MVAILPLLTSVLSSVANETGLKYFISQSIASIFFLFFSLLSMKVNVMFNLLTVLIVFKIGLPPLHSWITRIVFRASYGAIFLILTVQKFIPLLVLVNLDRSTILINIFIFLSFLISCVLVKNMITARPILVISAWRNSCWLLIVTQMSKLWVFFLVFYSLFTGTIIGLFSFYEINKLSSFYGAEVAVKLVSLMNFLNLAGLPPFAGFFLKVALLKFFITALSLFSLILLISLSLVALIAYFRIAFYAFSSPSFRGRRQGRSSLARVALIGSLVFGLTPGFLVFLF